MCQHGFGLMMIDCGDLSTLIPGQRSFGGTVQFENGGQFASVGLKGNGHVVLPRSKPELPRAPTTFPSLDRSCGQQFNVHPSSFA